MRPESGRTRQGFVAIALAIASKGRSPWLNAIFTSAPDPVLTTYGTNDIHAPNASRTKCASYSMKRAQGVFWKWPQGHYTPLESISARERFGWVKIPTRRTPPPLPH